MSDIDLTSVRRGLTAAKFRALDRGNSNEVLVFGYTEVPRDLSSAGQDEAARLLDIYASESPSAAAARDYRAAADFIRAHRRRSVLGKLHRVREHQRRKSFAKREALRADRIAYRDASRPSEYTRSR